MCPSSVVGASDFGDDVFDDLEPSREDVEKGVVEVVHPEPERRWGEYGDFRLVGHGEVTNPDTCGRFVSNRGCLNVEAHNRTLDKKFHGKVFWCKHPLSCKKASCPVCFKSGWAVREAGRAEARLMEGAKRFGLVEHAVASVPLCDYHLSFEKLRAKCRKVLRKRGFIGSALIFHGFRYKPSLGWYWSPHFHVLGFILGGYARCRNCKNRKCVGIGNFGKCDGFEAVTRKCYVNDKWIVKVFGKRKTIFGTVWYQLNHASYNSTVKNFHVITWWGVLSYCKLKFTPEMRKQLCPICQGELGGVCYVGLNPEQFRDKREGFADYREGGVVVWEEVKRRKGIASARITKSDYVDCSAEAVEKWECDYMAFSEKASKRALIDKLLPKKHWGASWTLPKRVNV